MSHSTNSVVVIGGGVSGLACAYRLKKLGLSVTLVEASPRVGGLVETVEKDGFLFESGPQSFQGTETLLSLIHDLGIDGELCKADPGAPRYILRQGRLRKVPMSPQAMLATSLLSPGTRWKIVSEPFKTHSATQRRRIGSGFRAAQIRPRDSRIPRFAVRFRASTPAIRKS